MSDSYFVTTTIPYVNAAPHIGFALELVQADVIARYLRLTGHDVRLQTGTDENAFKNVSSARARGIPVERLVDENSVRFRELSRALNVSLDTFVRTTDVAHRDAVATLLGRLRGDDLYRRSYRGLYCAGCEDFYFETDLVDGRCPEHGTPALAVEEENVFFRLSRYQSQVRELIASRRIHVIPESRELEVLRFIDRGLVDISISRDAARQQQWGIPFPCDPSQVVYVWIDALINYLTDAGHWCDATKLHLIGKNVWKFHAVYWPALLLSAGLPVPNRIVVHGFLTSEGKKISKSSGDAADPTEYVARFGVDGVRHFLLRHIRPFDDSDFSVARLEAAYTADLANGLGNVVSRLTALCESAGVRGVTLATPQAPADFHEHVTSFRFDLALASLWNELATLNREITESKPWQDLKAGRVEDARGRLESFASRLASVGYWLGPFLPSTSAAICRTLTQARIPKAAPLFPRLL